VLPSRQMGETWGLVVNEALLAEKRVIVSRYVGCHKDFLTLPALRIFNGTVHDLVETLRTIPSEASTRGQRQFMERYSVRSAARGIVEAIESSWEGQSAKWLPAEIKRPPDA